MSFAGKFTGAGGETRATKYLQDKGFTIVETNFSCRFGEIDIICEKAGKLHFVEVKTRVGLAKGQPYEAVNFNKLRHIRNTIDFYLLQKKLRNYKLSIDVVSIVLNEDRTPDKISIYENITL